MPPERIVRYATVGHVGYGRLEDGTLERLDRAPWEGGVPTGEFDPFYAARLLPPVIPSKIVCVGLNYRAHIAESRSFVPGSPPPSEPLLFLKPPSALIASGQPILYPGGVTRLDPEAELAVVIGRRARRVSVDEAWSHVAGITCINDVSARNYQAQDGQWTRAKGFDTFAPLGPWIVSGLAPQGLSVECRVNGESRQRGNTSDLIFPFS
jgi:2-keto-4-pentenoate hydratase/2-oxohepta-3-ene-1,7-dioic acid hydratase in catechol pathway